MFLRGCFKDWVDSYIYLVKCLKGVCWVPHHQYNLPDSVLNHKFHNCVLFASYIMLLDLKTFLIFYSKT